MKLQNSKQKRMDDQESKTFLISERVVNKIPGDRDLHAGQAFEILASCL